MNKPLGVFRLVSFFIRPQITLLMVVALVSSCKTTRKPIATTENKPTLDFKSARVLANNLKKNELDFAWLNTKFNCEATIDSSDNSFKVAMRAKKDSMLWFSIMKAGIEGARAVVTRDSVKFINRLEKTYFLGGLNYLAKLLQADIDYETLQSLLVGNSVEFYDEDEKLRSSIDDKHYELSTIRKRKLRKAIEKNRELKEPVQRIWLDPATFKITQLLFQDFNTNREFLAVFDDYRAIDSTSFFPHKIRYNIKAEKNVTILIEYTKVEKNVPQSFPFSIPADYRQLIYNEKEK